MSKGWWKRLFGGGGSEAESKESVPEAASTPQSEEGNGEADTEEPEETGWVLTDPE